MGFPLASLLVSLRNKLGYETVEELVEFLASKPPGPISELAEVGRILSQCWDKFIASDSEEMAAYKLERIEEASWNPPILSFIIERHGAIVLGSTRAELQRWDIDVEKLVATSYTAGSRQVLPMQRKLDVRPMAEEIVCLIVNRQEDDRLKWNHDGSVRVFVGKILPEGSAVKETLRGRRKRFRKVLDELLSDSGWQKVRTYVYAPPAA